MVGPENRTTGYASQPRCGLRHPTAAASCHSATSSNRVTESPRVAQLRSDRPRCVGPTVLVYPGSASWVGSPRKKPNRSSTAAGSGSGRRRTGGGGTASTGRSGGGSLSDGLGSRPGHPALAREPRGRSGQNLCALAQSPALSEFQDWQYLRKDRPKSVLQLQHFRLTRA